MTYLCQCLIKQDTLCFLQFTDKEIKYTVLTQEPTKIQPLCGWQSPSPLTQISKSWESTVHQGQAPYQMKNQEETILLCDTVL